MSITKGGLSRLKTWVSLNRGWRMRGEGDDRLVQLLFRKPELQLYDNYLNDLQYEHLEEWNGKVSEQQIDNRRNQPKKIFPIVKIATNQFKRHITTEQSRLNFSTDEEVKQGKIDDFVNFTMLWSHINEALPSYFVNGSMYFRFFAVNKGKILIENHNTKWVYPEFDDNEELISVVIRFIYETDEYNESGVRIWRWTQYKQTRTEDIIYDNPVFIEESQELPEFKVKSKMKHNMGFVQGVWIKTSLNSQSVDGESLLSGHGILDYIDDFNYLGSKESDSIFYHLFPLLVMYGIEPEDIKKVWQFMQTMGKANLRNLNTISTYKSPSEAQMHFLEANQSAANFAGAIQDKNLQLLQHCLSIVLLDPTTVANNYQSGKAMEALFKPVVEFVNEKREILKHGICDLFEKLEQVSVAYKTRVQLEPGTIFNADKKWGNIFSDTVFDVQTRAGYTVQLKAEGIISKKTATKHIAPDFGIKNVEEELKQIESEQETERENQLLDFQGEQDIISKNNPTPAPANKPKPANPKAK